MKGSVIFPRPVHWLTTVTTPRDVWLMYRREGVGGSEVAAVLGESRFTTAWEVWARKTGRIDDEPLNEAMRWGTLLEQEVAREWARRHDAKLRRLGMVADPVHPHRLASLDRAVLLPGTVRAHALLEVKTTGERAITLSDEDLAARYTTQVQWYLGVTGLRVAHLAVLVGGKELRHLQVDADEARFNELAGFVDAWWQRHVVEGEPPLLGWRDNTTLNGTPAAPGAVAHAGDETTGTLQRIRLLEAERIDLERALDTEKAFIKQVMGEATELLDDTGETVATWREQTANRLDTKRLRSEQPDTYRAYTQPQTTRVLRIKQPEENP